MSWSGGTYTKPLSWTANTTISATDHNTQDADFTTGINSCLVKDGTNAMTADLNFGGFKPSNVAAGSAATPSFSPGSDADTGMFLAATNAIGLATDGSERCRIDAGGNVGIATTSPSAKLHVAGTAIFSANDAGTAVRITQTGSGEAFRVEDETNPDTTPFVVTASGDVGIGTASPSVKLQVEGQAIINVNTSTTGVRITQTGSGEALRVEDEANPDTTPFVVTAAGLVGIGTSTPDRGLVVDSASNPLSAGEPSLLVTGSANKERIGVRHYGAGDPVFVGQRYLGTPSVPTAVTADQSLLGLSGQGYNGTALSSTAAFVGFYAAETFTPSAQGTYAQIETTPIGSTTRTVRLRVSPAGNVGIGTTSPSYPVDSVAESSGAVGVQIRGRSSDNVGVLRFSANNGTTEQARIQSNATGLEITQSGNNPIVFNQNGASRMSVEALSIDVKNRGIKYTGITVGGGTINDIGFKWNNPNLVGIVDNAVAVTIANVSDYRLKDQFSPLDSLNSLAKVKQLNPGSYYPKDFDGTVAYDRPQLGLIAHEVAEIAPSVVSGEKDQVNAEGNPIYQSVHYAGLVPLLIGAVKALSAKVEALEAEVTALKGG